MGQVEGTTSLPIGEDEATMHSTLTQEHPCKTGLWAELSDMVARLRRELFAGYHPERHYMRGPGPACRTKRAG
jgi:hypothetical protein